MTSHTLVVITVTSEGNDLVLVVVILALDSVVALTTDTVGGFGGGPFGLRGGKGGGLPAC